jgi:hypothetical protein
MLGVVAQASDPSCSEDKGGPQIQGQPHKGSKTLSQNEI